MLEKIEFYNCPDGTPDTRIMLMTEEQRQLQPLLPL